MNNILRILLIFIIFSGCSLNKNSNFWTNKKIKLEEQDNSKEIFAKEKQFIRNGGNFITHIPKPRIISK